jgi:hypothetical protein
MRVKQNYNDHAVTKKKNKSHAIYRAISRNEKVI